MKDNDIIIKRIKKQKEAFNNWDKELKKELSEKQNNPKKTIQLYLIKNVWLKNYIQIIFNGQNDSISSINSYKKFKMINNDYFFKVTTIKELPRVYPLNQECWLNFIKNKEKELNFEGKFYNKILFFKLLALNKCNIYCFFFLDEINNIKQGYIKINQEDKKKEIIK